MLLTLPAANNPAMLLTLPAATINIKRARCSRTASSSPFDDALEAGLPTQSNLFALPILLTKSHSLGDPVHYSSSQVQTMFPFSGDGQTQAATMIAV